MKGVVTERVAYTQLAEECTELAHAALKLGRKADPEQCFAMGDTAKERWLENLYEEIADVLVCVEAVLGFHAADEPMEKIERIKQEKKRRWQERLKGE